MQKTCDVCGNARLRKRHSGVGTILECRGCGSSYDYYYTKGGRLLDYPASWGRLITVIYEAAGTYDVVDGDEGDMSTVFAGYTYYLFESDDGTIRRARIEDIRSFSDEASKPSQVPKQVDVYHTWVVDVLPSADPVA